MPKCLITLLLALPFGSRLDQGLHPNRDDLQTTSIQSYIVAVDYINLDVTSAG